jgi:hypothetical protein
MTIARTETEFRFQSVIDEISLLNWGSLSEDQCIDVAWAYYYFSVQFRENLEIAREIFPDDAQLALLAREECATDNLSPWEGVAAEGEKMDHDEFMRRLLLLAPIDASRQRKLEAVGKAYLATVRSMDHRTRAVSIASYEDGGLEQVFHAMCRMVVATDPALRAFRHFLLEHIRFDSDPDGGHGALSRHLSPDDRILPIWRAFRDLLCDCVPRLAAAAENDSGADAELEAALPAAGS